MTKSETATVLATLKLAYPVFYSTFTKDDIANTVLLWTRMFSEYEYAVVTIAVEALIREHSGYPPDIAILIKKIEDLSEMASGSQTDEELWHTLKNAASNGYYGAEEEFEKLPDTLKCYLGDPSTLRELSITEEETFNTVSKGQFLKQIKATRERVAFDKKTPDSIKKILGKSFAPLSSGNKLLSPDEFNTRRNKILDQLS